MDEAKFDCIEVESLTITFPLRNDVTRRILILEIFIPYFLDLSKMVLERCVTKCKWRNVLSLVDLGRQNTALLRQQMRLISWIHAFSVHHLLIYFAHWAEEYFGGGERETSHLAFSNILIISRKRGIAQKYQDNAISSVLVFSAFSEPWLDKWAYVQSHCESWGT